MPSNKYGDYFRSNEGCAELSKYGLNDIDCLSFRQRFICESGKEIKIKSFIFFISIFNYKLLIKKINWEKERKFWKKVKLIFV